MTKLRFICMTSIFCLLLSGCGGNIPIDTQGLTNELKESFRQEVMSFFENDDLEETLGISKEKQEAIEQSIQSYIDSYELDENAINQAKEAVYDVLEEAKGLSTEQIDKKLAEIFKPSNQ